jgi:hypothetical protein
VSIKGGGSKQIVGFRYIMAQHSGISRGPVNEFCEIRVGDLAVWTGGITESGFDAINAPDAFGGDEKEGGISAISRSSWARPTQVDRFHYHRPDRGRPACPRLARGSLALLLRTDRLEQPVSQELEI